MADQLAVQAAWEMQLPREGVSRVYSTLAMMAVPFRRASGITAIPRMLIRILAFAALTTTD